MGVYSPDEVIPAPSLTAPPLSLVSICESQDRVIDTDTRVIYDATFRGTKVTSTSARFKPTDEGARVSVSAELLEENAVGEDLKGWPGWVIRTVIDENTVELDEEVGILDGTSATLTLVSPLPERWIGGATFIPEPTALAEMWAPGGGTTKAQGDLTPTFVGYDPFVVVYRDERSLFGWGAAEYAARARRGLIAHESYGVEREWWGGYTISSNPHLTASPSTPAAGSAGRTITFTNPTAAPGTTLDTAVGLAQGLASLDQAIADADCGVGMIHCSPFLLSMWTTRFQNLREEGDVYSVNYNLIVPGYGYESTGPDITSRTVADGVTNTTTTVTSATAAFTEDDVDQPISGGTIPAGATIVSITSGTSVVISAAASGSAGGVTITIGGASRASGNRYQWAYATDAVTLVRGPLMEYPHVDDGDLTEMSPLTATHNAAAFRAERAWAVLTNGACRSAVLIDTTAP